MSLTTSGLTVESYTKSVLLKRFAIFYSIIIVYGYFFIEEYPIDWSDRHDEKFKNKVYGDMENSGGLEEEED